MLAFSLSLAILTAFPDMLAISLSLVNTAGTVSFGGANIVLCELLLVYNRDALNHLVRDFSQGQ